MQPYSAGELVILAPASDKAQMIISATDAFLRLDTVYQGKPLSLYSIHLWTPVSQKPLLQGTTISYKTPQLARKEQMIELLSQVGESAQGATTLVIGDFNTMQNGKLIRNLADPQISGLSLISVPLFANRNTFTSKHPLIQLDFVFISSEKIGGAKLRTSCEYSASDHCLLILDVVL